MIYVCACVCMWISKNTKNPALCNCRRKYQRLIGDIYLLQIVTYTIEFKALMFHGGMGREVGFFLFN